MNKTLRNRGFTLIELMIGVVIVGILVGIAYPSYSAQVAKGRRADGRSAVLALAQRMERFYTERGTYVGATVGNTGIYPSTSDQGFYSLSIVSQTATAFSIKAAPTGRQSGDACGSYLYNQAGDKTLDADATLTASVCW